MSLLDIKIGKSVKIVGFEGGKGLKTKMTRYGLYPGDIARLLRVAPFHGPVLIEVSGREIALGRGVAANVQVESI
jgi:Fe2+ transport system protein FeoA